MAVDIIILLVLATIIAIVIRSFHDVYRWICTVIRPPATRWRTEFDWTEKNREGLLRYFEEYKPPFKLPTTNILIVGVSGAGKSSFINTVVSAVKREVVCCAAARGNKISVTKRIRRYKNILKNIHLCDTIGLPESHEQMDEVEQLLLTGKMPSQSTETSSQGIAEYIHAGVIIVEPVTLQNDVDEIKRNVGKIQDMFEEKEIPYVMLITKMDKINATYQDSLQKMFCDHEIKQLVELAAAAFGVPRNRVWPMINYESDHVTQCHIDILALSVLKIVLRFAAAYIEVLHDPPSNTD